MTTTRSSSHSTSAHHTTRTTPVHHPKKAATTAPVKGKLKNIDLKHLPPGMNPELAKRVKALGLNTDKSLQPTGKRGTKSRTTHCNQAFNKYAKQFGYTGFMNKKGEPMLANDMFKKMSAPGSGWRAVSAKEAIQAAKDGKLAVASAINKGGHGHVAAITGEFSPGVPGISQAGGSNFEFGTWQSRSEKPTYFVRD